MTHLETIHQDGHTTATVARDFRTPRLWGRMVSASFLDIVIHPVQASGASYSLNAVFDSGEKNRRDEC